MSYFDSAWEWLRFGTKGDYVEEGNRKIVRASDYLDTVWFACHCFENEKYVKTLYGREAIYWVLGEE